jgi:hypothetical protein
LIPQNGMLHKARPTSAAGNLTMMSGGRL